jgi:signal transduction histidine kinase
VPATGSEADRRRRIRFGPARPRLSLRLRLTLLYGACFVIGAAAVIGLTYVIVAHSTSSQVRDLQVHGTSLHLPPFALTVETPGATESNGKPTMSVQRVQVSAKGTETITLVPSSSEAQIIKQSQKKLQLERLSSAQMARIRKGALLTSRCMRAHGLKYPDLAVGTLAGYGYAFGLRPGTHGLSQAEIGSAAFQTANKACAQLLDPYLPGVSLPDLQSDGIGAAAQKQVNVLVDRANGALSTERSRSLSILLTWLGVALGVLAIVSILLGWIVAGQGLAPMRAMTSRARRITEENLHERLSTETSEDELGELARTFDDVLVRLERSFDAQKQFVANASHELRTPVTFERTLLELALASPDADTETLRRTCERVLASNHHQQQMIESLLMLARSQSGTDVNLAVNLADLAEEAMLLRENRLSDLDVTTQLHRAMLQGDTALLERLVSNLIDNAITHNLADGGWITVETGDTGAGCWLAVSNSGALVPESAAPEIFKPFRRVDAERTATATGGAGLGLSIVQAISDVHGAAIKTSPLAGGGLRLEVRFQTKLSQSSQQSRFVVD